MSISSYLDSSTSQNLLDRLILKNIDEFATYAKKVVNKRKKHYNKLTNKIKKNKTYQDKLDIVEGVILQNLFNEYQQVRENRLERRENRLERRRIRKERRDRKLSKKKEKIQRYQDKFDNQEFSHI